MESPIWKVPQAQKHPKLVSDDVKHTVIFIEFPRLVNNASLNVPQFKPQSSFEQEK